MPAPKGNTNKAKGIAIRQILISELENGGRDRVREAIRQQIKKAEEGDLKALEFLADRVDGRPAQSVQLSGDAENPVRIVASALSDDDLAKIAAGAILPIQQE